MTRIDQPPAVPLMDRLTAPRKVSSFLSEEKPAAETLAEERMEED